MKKPLIDVIFASEKRKNVLLLLNSGPKEMSTLLTHLKTNRPALLPQIRILEDHHLITQFDDTYQLTTIGKLLVDEIEPLLRTTDALDVDIDYWGTRRLDFLPKSLLERIGELADHEIIEPGTLDLHDINFKFYEKTMKSKSVNLICRFFYPNCCSFFLEWIKNNVQVSVIVDRELLRKIKMNYANEFRNLIDSGRTTLYLYPDEIEFMKLAQNDYCVLLMLFDKKIGYDNKTLLNFNPDSFEWGKELFECYRQKSIKITDIDE